MKQNFRQNPKNVAWQNPQTGKARLGRAAAWSFKSESDP
jgi:hypothetical protein